MARAFFESVFRYRDSEDRAIACLSRASAEVLTRVEEMSFESRRDERMARRVIERAAPAIRARARKRKRKRKRKSRR